MHSADAGFVKKSDDHKKKKRKRGKGRKEKRLALSLGRVCIFVRKRIKESNVVLCTSSIERSRIKATNWSLRLDYVSLEILNCN